MDLAVCVEVLPSVPSFGDIFGGVNIILYFFHSKNVIFTLPN